MSALYERDPILRFIDRIEKREDGCWQWTGPVGNSGYCRWSVEGDGVFVHRWSFERFVRPLWPGEVVDHLCNNKRCVNPDHLRGCSQRSNVLRSETALAAINARKTHCLRGHELDGVNTYVNPRTGTRRCRKCHADKQRERNRIARRAARVAR